MTIPKKYFHDRLVLLLLSINGFITLLATIWISLSLSSTHSTGYIIQCRDCSNAANLNRFTSSSNAFELFSFIIFAFLIFGINFLLSLRIYEIHRQLSVIILSLSLLLLVLTIIVSNALLVLR